MTISAQYLLDIVIIPTLEYFAEILIYQTRCNLICLPLPLPFCSLQSQVRVLETVFFLKCIWAGQLFHTLKYPLEVPQSFKAWECGQSWLHCLCPVCRMSWQPIHLSLKFGFRIGFCSLPLNQALRPGKCCNRVSSLQKSPRDSSSWT